MQVIHERHERHPRHQQKDGCQPLAGRVLTFNVVSSMNKKENDLPIVQKARMTELLYKLKLMTEDKDILVTCDLEKSTG